MTASGEPVWTIFPSFMTAIRSDKRRASRRSWVAITAVVLVSFKIRWRSSIRPSRVGGSREEKGFVEEDDFRMNGEGSGQACPLRLSSG